MISRIVLLFFGICLIFFGYANADRLSAQGYWLQKDSATNTNVSVVHAYENDEGNLNAEIFVPLSNADNGMVHAPIIYCKNCGKGDAYGNKYDYSSGHDKYQGLEFVWNAKKVQSSGFKDNGPIYNDGAVLNPHDGKYYHVKARTINNGKKVYVRAFWSFLGKDEYWERITKKKLLE